LLLIFPGITGTAGLNSSEVLSSLFALDSVHRCMPDQFFRVLDMLLARFWYLVFC